MPSPAARSLRSHIPAAKERKAFVTCSGGVLRARTAEGIPFPGGRERPAVYCGKSCLPPLSGRRGVRAVSAVCVPSPQQAGLFHHRFGPRRYGPYQPAHRRFIRYALHLLFRHEGSAPHRYPCRARPSASCSRNRKSGKPLVMQKPGGGSFRAFAYLMFI